MEMNRELYGDVGVRMLLQAPGRRHTILLDPGAPKDSIQLRLQKQAQQRPRSQERRLTRCIPGDCKPLNSKFCMKQFLNNQLDDAMRPPVLVGIH